MLNVDNISLYYGAAQALQPADGVGEGEVQGNAGAVAHRVAGGLALADRHRADLRDGIPRTAAPRLGHNL